MTGDFPVDYYPFGVDMVLLIEQFGVVQFLGGSRATDSHACYASGVSFFGNRNHHFRKVNPDSDDGNRDGTDYTSNTFGCILRPHEGGELFNWNLHSSPRSFLG